MRAAFTALWSMIQMVIEGLEEFAKAFKGVGEIASTTVQTIKEEELILSKQRQEEIKLKHAKFIAEQKAKDEA